MQISDETARYELYHLNLYCLQKTDIAFDAERLYILYHIVCCSIDGEWHLFLVLEIK